MPRKRNPVKDAERSRLYKEKKRRLHEEQQQQLQRAINNVATLQQAVESVMTQQQQQQQMPAWLSRQTESEQTVKVNNDMTLDIAESLLDSTREDPVANDEVQGKVRVQHSVRSGTAKGTASGTANENPLGIETTEGLSIVRRSDIAPLRGNIWSSIDW